MEWIDLHGRHHGQCWLFKSEHFHADLETIASPFTGAVAAVRPVQVAGLRPRFRWKSSSAAPSLLSFV